MKKEMSGELIIFAQAMAEVEPDIDLLIDSVIEKYGFETYLQLLIDMGSNIFMGLLSEEFDLDDEGNEIDWVDL